MPRGWRAYNGATRGKQGKPQRVGRGGYQTANAGERSALIAERYLDAQKGTQLKRSSRCPVTNAVPVNEPLCALARGPAAGGPYMRKISARHKRGAHRDIAAGACAATFG
jgi:hypothetical protein